jgi:hypothetical protein
VGQERYVWESQKEKKRPSSPFFSLFSFVSLVVKVQDEPGTMMQSVGMGELQQEQFDGWGLKYALDRDAVDRGSGRGFFQPHHSSA